MEKIERKSEETSTNSNQQPIQSNPYVNPNINQQQQVTNENRPDGPPPPYVENYQPLTTAKSPNPNPVQNSSLNNPSTIIPNYRWGRHSTEIVCPKCNTNIHTKVETSSTIITVILALVLAFFCLCLGLLPFCIRSCKKTTHYCPNCNSVLGEVEEFQ